MMAAIPKIHNPTIAEFQHNFLDRHQPCIITGAIDNWSALSCWTIDYLKSKIGDKVVPCRVSSTDYFDNYRSRQQIEIAKYLDWVAAPEREDTWQGLFDRQQPLHYFVGSLNLQTYFSELLNDVSMPKYCDPKLLVSNNLWIGRGRNRVNLHYDLFHNINAQIVGQKKWAIFPPQQSDALYPHPWHTRMFWCSQVNIDRPDLTKFPKFAAVTPIEVTVNPGELIFLPIGWWHSPIGIGTNIAINFWWRMSLVEVINRLFFKHKAKELQLS